MIAYQNYHKHCFDSNIYMTDSATHIEDYAKKAIELGHKTLSTVEHGYCGRFLFDYEIAEKYGLKLIIGCEAYWVKNRLENDKTNNHIIILAKNENGRQWINEVLSQANETGLFNGRPRLDWELIDLLPSDDVFITSACVGFNGYGYEDSKTMIEMLHNKFKDNFMLEVQYHNTEYQKKYNEFLVRLSKKSGIKLIMGCDSHMIDDSQKIDRDDLLASRDIKYPDEDGWYMDYTDGDTCYDRFIKQGILSHDEILDAINNTNVVLSFEDFKFCRESKLPTIYPSKSQKERDTIYKKLVCGGWNSFKNSVSEDTHREYMDDIKKEVSVVCNTKMADYFIINEAIIREGVANGGIITPSGRGSAGSFLTNTMLGFSTMDRVESEVKLYPERFMSESRILDSGSLPDIDFNLGNVEVFEDAQRKILGEGHSYPFVAFGTLKPKSAFKMYARSQDLDSTIAQEISDQIGKYQHDYNKAEDDAKDEIELLDYIDEKYHPYIEASEKYLGIVVDKKRHPCGHLLYMGNIRRELGLIRIISKSTGKDVMCVNLEGAVADRWGYVKNDLLKVDVHLLVQRVCDRAGIKRPSSKELLEITKGDKKTWDIYANGYTCLVNQVDGDGTKAKAMKYKPQSYSELSAFVAAIRPGFKSNYAKFEKREPFSYGIPALDNLLQTPAFPYSYMLYQEQTMAVLNYAGIPMDECYDVIKAISKKKVDKIRKVKDRFFEGFANKLKLEDASLTEERIETIINQAWTVIIDSARYSFNASHSLAYAIDSIYCAWLKAHHPYEFYEVALQMYSDKGKKDKVNQLIKEMKEGFGIQCGKFRFRQDNRRFNMDIENNIIYPSMLSIKNMNDKVANELYLMRDMEFDTFTDVLIYLLEDTMLTKTHINILIKVKYFEEFGKSKKLDSLYKKFQDTYKKQHVEKTKIVRREMVIEYEKTLDDKGYGIKDQYLHEIELLGYPISTIDKAPENLYVVSEYDDKYAIKLRCYNIRSGDVTKFTMYRDDFKLCPIGLGSIIQFDSYLLKKDGSYRLKEYRVL